MITIKQWKPQNLTLGGPYWVVLNYDEAIYVVETKEECDNKVKFLESMGCQIEEAAE